MNVNGWIDHKIVKILEKLGLPLPGGNSEQLHLIAGHWDKMAGSLNATVDWLDAEVRAVSPQQWPDPGREHFTQAWGHHRERVNQGAANFRQVAQSLRRYADRIEAINGEIVDICLQIAEMEAAGALLAAVTVGISEAAATVAGAQRVARIGALVGEFEQCAQQVATALEALTGLSAQTAAALGRMAEFAAQATVGFAKAFVPNMAADTGAIMLNQKMSGQHVTLGADLANGFVDAIGTAALTTLGGMAAQSIFGTPGADGVYQTALGNVLTGEGIAGTAVNGAVTNMAGTVVEDVYDNAVDPDPAHHKGISQIAQDLAVSAATGVAGNVAGARLGLTPTAATAFDTGLYSSGASIQSDLQDAIRALPSAATGPADRDGKPVPSPKLPKNAENAENTESAENTENEQGR